MKPSVSSTSAADNSASEKVVALSRSLVTWRKALAIRVDFRNFVSFGSSSASSVSSIIRAHVSSCASVMR